MAIAYKCDVCGTFSNINANNKPYKNMPYLMRAEIIKGSLPTDLCVSCFCSLLASFIAVIRNEYEK